MCYTGDNTIRRVSDDSVITGGQIILAQDSSLFCSTGWSVFTVGDLCTGRRAFVFKLGGRCDKIALGFCFPGTDPAQEGLLMKRFQVKSSIYCSPIV
jgi:hypothetical protein